MRSGRSLSRRRAHRRHSHGEVGCRQRCGSRRSRRRDVSPRSWRQSRSWPSSRRRLWWRLPVLRSSTPPLSPGTLLREAISSSAVLLLLVGRLDVVTSTTRPSIESTSWTPAAGGLARPQVGHHSCGTAPDSNRLRSCALPRGKDRRVPGILPGTASVADWAGPGPEPYTPGVNLRRLLIAAAALTLAVVVGRWRTGAQHPPPTRNDGWRAGRPTRRRRPRLRVAVRPTSDVGRRAVHVLLADPSVEAVGVLGTQPSHTAGGRLNRWSPRRVGTSWCSTLIRTRVSLIPVVASTKTGVVASRCLGVDRRRRAGCVDRSVDRAGITPYRRHPGSLPRSGRGPAGSPCRDDLSGPPPATTCWRPVHRALDRAFAVGQRRRADRSGGGGRACRFPARCDPGGSRHGHSSRLVVGEARRSGVRLIEGARRRGIVVASPARGSSTAEGAQPTRRPC